MFRFTSPFSAVLLALALAASACVEQDPIELGPNTTRPQFGYGDVIVVTNTNDNGLGSLRWAISHATSAETINFDPSIAGQTIALDSQLVIPNPMAIEGPPGKGMTINGSGKGRIFYMPHKANTTLRNLTLTGGNSGPEAGGAISSAQSVSLYNSTLTGNVAPGGAAIAGYNVALFNSTASGNTSTDGGAVVFAASHLHIINSTVAYNTGKGVGGGEVLHLFNALVSNNSNRNCGNFIYGVRYEATAISDDDSCGGPTDITIANPQLAALADNGGPTRTHALMAGSPAINAGTKCTVVVDYEFDQRYVPRDSACDVGAFEFINFTTITLTVDPSPAINPITKFAVLTGTVQCSRNETFDIAVELKQEQRTSRATQVVQATGTTPVACSTTASPWSVALAPSTGSFMVGTAMASANTANTDGWVTPATTSLPVRLFLGHR